MAVPLNLGAEVREPRVVDRFLLWATGITMGVYLLGTLAVSAVLPPGDLGNPAFLTELFTSVWGPLGTLLGTANELVLIVYFLCAIAAFNLLFARLLLVAAIDQRLPARVARLRAGEPLTATLLQSGINLLFLVAVFLIAPVVVPSVAQLSTAVFLVTINGASLIWNLAMIGLFLCGIILVQRARRTWQGRWVLPPALLSLACVLGMGASAIAIGSTLFAGSPLPAVLTNANWNYWVLVVTLASLAVGAIVSFLAPEAEDLSAFLARRAHRQAGPLTTSASASSLPGHAARAAVPPASARSAPMPVRPSSGPQGVRPGSRSGSLGAARDGAEHRTLL
jgi:hypothetical protein